jgi:hypothetical protein
MHVVQRQCNSRLCTCMHVVQTNLKPTGGDCCMRGTRDIQQLCVYWPDAVIVYSTAGVGAVSCRDCGSVQSMPSQTSGCTDQQVWCNTSMLKRVILPHKVRQCHVYYYNWTAQCTATTDMTSAEAIHHCPPLQLLPGSRSYCPRTTNIAICML